MLCDDLCKQLGQSAQGLLLTQAVIIGKTQGRYRASSLGQPHAHYSGGLSKHER